MSTRRITLAALAVLSLTISSASTVRAQSLWTLTATPLVATAQQSTTFHVLATNVLGPPAGCVNVEIPSSFAIQWVGNVVAADGAVWTAAVAGTWVDVTSASGSEMLDPLEWVSFDLQLVPTQAGTWSWNNHIHVSNRCTGTQYNGAPVVVVVAPGPTPTPVPTPTPIPIPTAIPTLPPLPTLLPTVPPIATPLPTLPPVPGLTPSPDPTSGASAAPPTSGPRATSAPEPAAIGGSPNTSGGPSGSVGRIAELDDGGIGSISLGAEVFGLLDGQFVWFVPGAAVGVPGLLVLLWIALQTVGALAWVPAVRRMGGDPMAARRRRRRPALV